MLAIAGCGDDGRGGRRRGDDGGSGDAATRDGARSDGGTENEGGTLPASDGGTIPDDCADRARWVYLVDSDRTLLRFEPDRLAFEEIGTVDCPSGDATPFSMAVDRDARAWVLHSDGRLYAVSTADASCEATAFAPDQDGFERFGMGFATDGPASTNETLFVGGGSQGLFGGSSPRLGRIDLTSLELTAIGGLPEFPELTGTGEGELWGFFPNEVPATVRRIDKTTATTHETFRIDEVGLGAQAWAFAFWGGRFYLFLQALSDTSTNVYRLDPDSGAVTEVVSSTGRRIVGAGVSTCAPVDLI
jgi:hypothetical protein